MLKKPCFPIFTSTSNTRRPLWKTAFSAWWYLKYHNQLPEVGGWLSQPLAFLAEIEAVDLVVSTYQYIGEKDAKWDKLNSTQLAIIQELGQ